MPYEPALAKILGESTKDKGEKHPSSNAASCSSQVQGGREVVPIAGCSKRSRSKGCTPEQAPKKPRSGGQAPTYGAIAGSSRRGRSYYNHEPNVTSTPSTREVKQNGKRVNDRRIDEAYEIMKQTVFKKANKNNNNIFGDYVPTKLNVCNRDHHTAGGSQTYHHIYLQHLSQRSRNMQNISKPRHGVMFIGIKFNINRNSRFSVWRRVQLKWSPWRASPDSENSEALVAAFHNRILRGRPSQGYPLTVVMVTDIRGLKYTPVGDIYYKLRLSDE
ncbi:unnamed protein product [Acanthoscelides obtectus]|uniref:Uncharacterized protein n=1 Tax=Acanthoscelides obtectus TaxID=200917 RepID=A0A9P0L762_ACAOB|nr:unnamed protein product [Acanthoscelides obtectus]CAK1641509.1 hypothetical protein AOBTE_LOCUS12450 [Acanthoscelides obtectus]